jgi:hypothetical protein
LSGHDALVAKLAARGYLSGLFALAAPFGQTSGNAYKRPFTGVSDTTQLDDQRLWTTDTGELIRIQATEPKLANDSIVDHGDSNTRGRSFRLR